MRKKRREHRPWKWLCCLLLILGIVGFFYVSQVPDKKIGAASLYGTGEVVSEMEYLPADNDGELVRHSYYSLSFNEQHKQANWVYYRLELEGKEGTAERSDRFKEDRKVSTGSASPSDYTKSGYDRGHLCPAADMSQSVEAMNETFFMSNISPQLPVFNRGVWKKLEKQVRDWAKREQIYVVTGPVFKDNKGKIGKSKVTIPGYFYKVVYSPARRQMIAFLLPNTKEKRELQNYVVVVDSVERLTKIDFFPQLPDTLENRLEAYADYAKWR